MPTILDTLGVQMCTISYGKEASFAGKLANVTITVTPMAAGVGPIRLNWAATGDIFSPFSDTTSGDTGAPGIIALPRTDQDGFRHGSSPFKNWYYKAAVVAELADGQQLTRTYQFQTTSSTLDLDLLDEDSVVTALPVIVGPGTEPAGLSDATRTQLAATYFTLKQAAKEPELLIVGSLTRDPNGAVTSAAVVWPDGTPGTYTPTYDSIGAVSSYVITYGSPTSKTFTQPAITRDSTGAPTNIPQIVVN